MICIHFATYNVIYILFLPQASKQLVRNPINCENDNRCFSSLLEMEQN